MKKTFEHPYHRTQTTLEVKDGQFLTAGQIDRLEKELCGMDDCNCNFYPVASADGHWMICKGGEVVADEVSKAASALGHKTSTGKAETSRENGKSGGRPRKS